MFESLVSMGNNLMDGVSGLFGGGGQTPFKLDNNLMNQFAGQAGDTTSLAGRGIVNDPMGLAGMSLEDLQKQNLMRMMNKPSFDLTDILKGGLAFRQDGREGDLFDKRMRGLDQEYFANEESLAKKRASDSSLAKAFGTEYWADRTGYTPKA